MENIEKGTNLFELLADIEILERKIEERLEEKKNEN